MLLALSHRNRVHSTTQANPLPLTQGRSKHTTHRSIEVSISSHDVDVRMRAGIFRGRGEGSVGFPNERLLAPGRGESGKRCVRSEGPLGGSSFGVWVRGFMELG